MLRNVRKHLSQPQNRYGPPRELTALERMAFSRPLDLDERAGFVHDDVHVCFRVGILNVVEIEYGLAAYDADRHGGDVAVYRVGLKLFSP